MPTLVAMSVRNRLAICITHNKFCNCLSDNVYTLSIVDHIAFLPGAQKGKYTSYDRRLSYA